MRPRRRRPARRILSAHLPTSICGKATFLGWRRKVRRPDASAPAPDRRGLPSPLIFHLASASAILEQGIALAPLSRDPRFPWRPELRDRGHALCELDMVDVSLEAARRLSRMLAGIERWQTHPHRRTLPDPPVLWQSGSTRLLDFGGSGPPVLAIPSLINRAYVLDLGPETSLMRYLARRGLRAMLLDWGVPGGEETGFDLTAWHDLRLLPALRAASAAHGAPALIGYCMGGGLATAAVQTSGLPIPRLALIGAPWEFGLGKGVGPTLRGAARDYGIDRLTEQLRGLDNSFGAVPADMLQLLFALLDPGLALKKFRHFAALPRHGAAARRFVEVEDWLNDPVPLPGPTAIEVLIDWQLRNVTGRGQWMLAGQRIRPETLSLPVLAFCSPSDRIAPPDSTLPLARAISGARILAPRAGHVGMIVGRQAPADVWEPLREFLAQPGGCDQYTDG